MRAVAGSSMASSLSNSPLHRNLTRTSGIRSPQARLAAFWQARTLEPCRVMYAPRSGWGTPAAAAAAVLPARMQTPLDCMHALRQRRRLCTQPQAAPSHLRPLHHHHHAASAAHAPQQPPPPPHTGNAGTGGSGGGGGGGSGGSMQPVDYTTLRALCAELAAAWVPAKVEQVRCNHYAHTTPAPCTTRHTTPQRTTRVPCTTVNPMHWKLPRKGQLPVLARGTRQQAQACW